MELVLDPVFDADLLDVIDIAWSWSESKAVEHVQCALFGRKIPDWIDGRIIALLGAAFRFCQR